MPRSMDWPKKTKLWGYFVPLSNMSFPQRHVKKAGSLWLAEYRDGWPRNEHYFHKYFWFKISAYFWLRKTFRENSPYWQQRFAFKYMDGENR